MSDAVERAGEALINAMREFVAALTATIASAPIRRGGGADQDAARTGGGRPPSQSIPPGSAAEYRARGVPDDFAANRERMTVHQLAAHYGVSASTITVWVKRLGLPKKSNGFRPDKPAANGVRRAESASAAWATPEIGGGKFVPTPAPRKDTGLPPAPFDDTRVSSADTLIQFLRGRDVIVARLPDGKFRIDGRRNVDLAGLLALANDKRALMKKPPFAMEA